MIETGTTKSDVFLDSDWMSISDTDNNILIATHHAMRMKLCQNFCITDIVHEDTDRIMSLGE